MDSIIDIRNLLKRYGIFIYTGNRIGDLELMEGEIRDLYEAKIINITYYQKAMLILRHEKSNLIP